MNNAEVGMPIKNITLIGMPGAGKSTYGRALAQKLGFEFIDGDEYIEKREKMGLPQIIGNKGDKGFLEIEEERLLEILPMEKHVLAPGGSIVYSDKLMKAIKNSSIVIFLDEPIQIIKQRLSDEKAERIIGLKSRTLEELFIERGPLYKKYADITIDCFGKPNNKIVDEIVEKYQSFL